ncbi:MAG: acetolactate synthase small subunit [Candidatus Omnitrophota bacterium]
MRHIISVQVENKFGVLARVSGLFSARGFNIDSLAVGETEDPTVSRMTILVRGDDKTLEQVKKQLNKLIDVISVKDFIKKEHIDRELLLFKVSVNKETKPKIDKILDKFGAKAIKSSDNILTVEAVGGPEEVAGLLTELNEFEIKEMVRTGRIAMAL